MTSARRLGDALEAANDLELDSSGTFDFDVGVMADMQRLRVGLPIDPGVPWTTSLGEPPLALALKSGNFGAPDFFIKAFACAP